MADAPSRAMRHVELPGGERLPVLGQGTYRMGADPDARRREIAALRTGIDLGMTVIDTAEMYADGGAERIVGEASVRYQAPLRFDDEYDIRVRVGEIRNSSWVFEYAFDRADGQRCAVGATTQVILDHATGKVARIPAHLRETLERAKAG